MNPAKLISLGTMYVDINCINFPFDKGLFAHRETTGDGYQLELGGSALNFAKLAAQLGLQTIFIGKVGNDTMGEVLINLMKQNDIHPSVIVDTNAQTNLAIHYIHKDGSSIMTSVGSANQALDYSEIQTKLEELEDTCDFLYLGGGFKLKKLLAKLPEIAKTAQKKGAKIVLDHGRVNNNVTKADIEMVHKLIPYVDIYLPSIDEFLAVWDVQTIEEGITKIKNAADPLIVVKQGNLGATSFYNGKRIDVPAYNVTAINTVGAGDSFNAGFIKAYSKTADLQTTIRYACATAAIKISSITELRLDAIEALYTKSSTP